MYICMQSLINNLHALSLPSSLSFFCIPNRLAYVQACIVCVYVCAHTGVLCWQDGVSHCEAVTLMETTRMGLSRVYTASQR